MSKLALIVLVTVGMVGMSDPAFGGETVFKIVKKSSLSPPEKPARFKKCDGALQKIFESGGVGTMAVSSGGPGPGALQMISVPNDGMVLVDAIAEKDARELTIDLTALGMQRASVFGRVVSGRLPIAALPSLDNLKSLRFARSDVAFTHAGRVTSQGDAAMRAGFARSTFGVDGTGIKVGILSDSFDCAGTETSKDMWWGDLPPVVSILDDTGCTGGTTLDEGRAMAQIVHDVAPGSSIAFHTAWNGQADFANGILQLRDGGCKVITDDVIYFAEPMFTDGVVAQAVDQAKASGVVYFSSAGNEARQAWEDSGGFRPSGFYPFGLPDPSGGWGQAHDFDPGPGVQTHLKVVLGPGATYFSFQWNEPYASASPLSPGARTDLDIMFYDPSGLFLYGYSVLPNIGGDPVEAGSGSFVINRGTSPVTAWMYIIQYLPDPGAPQPPLPSFLKMVWFGDLTIDPTQFDGVLGEVNKGSLYGHANARGAVAVGASYYWTTPAYGPGPLVPDYYSSAGPTPILLTPAGLPDYQLRLKPELVGPDGGDTTFFPPWTGADYEPNGWPNFFGTSASAPHVAAVAALARQKLKYLTPDQVIGALENTAIDMLTPGFDYDSGYGFVQADAALAALFPVGDLNYDGCVDRTDLDIIMAAVRAHSTDLRYDLNGDGRVDIADARFLVTRFTNAGGAPCVMSAAKAMTKTPLRAEY